MFWRQKTDPLRILIHVPKTAGSTLNAHLSGQGRGVAHVERFAIHPGRLAWRLRRADWVSGHLALNRMSALLAATTSRELHIFGLMRDPIRQVASQYNWLMEIRQRGGRFFAAHPEGIRAFSERLWASDNADPAVVIENIRYKPMLFLNLQARFLLGDDVDLNKADRGPMLARYRALDTAPDRLARAMTGQALRPGLRENASAYHVDRSVFDSAEMRDFLARNHRHDLRLFAQLSERVQ